MSTTIVYPPTFDRVMETTTTTGTGTLTLGGAVTGYQAFSVVGNANKAAYSIWAVDANGVPNGAWETGYGTYTLSGTTLSRDQVVSSSNSGSLVSFSAGTKRVALVSHSQGQNTTPFGFVLQPPASLSWSWLDQGGSTIATVGNNFLSLQVPAQAALHARGRVKSLAFSSGYTLTACLSHAGNMGQGTDDWGIFLRDSGTGKMVLLTMQFGASAGQLMTIGGFAFTSTTVFSTAYFQNNTYPGNPVFLRFVDDTTNRLFQISHDGLSFLTLFSHARTTFMTPDTCGFYADPESNTIPTMVNLLSWSETSP